MLKRIALTVGFTLLLVWIGFTFITPFVLLIIGGDGPIPIWYWCFSAGPVFLVLVIVVLGLIGRWGFQFFEGIVDTYKEIWKD